MSGGAGARICSPDPSLAQLGEEVGLVEFELIHDGGDLEILQRGGWTEVGEKRRVRGIDLWPREAGSGGVLAGWHPPPTRPRRRTLPRPRAAPSGSGPGRRPPPVEQERSVREAARSTGARSRGRLPADRAMFVQHRRWASSNP